MSNFVNEQDVRIVYELNSTIKLVDKALVLFKQNYDKASALSNKNMEELTGEDLLIFEGLTSRFSRISDIIIQQILKGYFIFIAENTNTALDRIHLAAKLNMIADENVLLAIRKVRNTIVHEYAQEHLSEIFEQVLEYAPELMAYYESIKNYMAEKHPEFSGQ